MMPLEPNEGGTQLIHVELNPYELGRGVSAGVAAVAASAAFFWANFSIRWPRGCGCQQNWITNRYLRSLNCFGWSAPAAPAVPKAAPSGPGGRAMAPPGLLAFSGDSG